MLYIRDEHQPLETWRPGVDTRMLVSSASGAAQLTVFEQWCDPQHGAPLHIHAVEEVLRVLAGSADITIADETQRVEAGESVIIPAGQAHGFVNSGSVPLHTLAILAAPIFEVHYLEDQRDNRRWGPEIGVSTHDKAPELG